MPGDGDGIGEAVGADGARAWDNQCQRRAWFWGKAPGNQLASGVCTSARMERRRVGTTLHSAAPSSEARPTNFSTTARPCPRASGGGDIDLFDDAAAVGEAEMRVRVADVEEEDHILFFHGDVAADDAFEAAVLGAQAAGRRRRRAIRRGPAIFRSPMRMATRWPRVEQCSSHSSATASNLPAQTRVVITIKFPQDFDGELRRGPGGGRFQFCSEVASLRKSGGKFRRRADSRRRRCRG